MTELVIAGNVINPDRQPLTPMNSYLAHAIFRHGPRPSTWKHEGTEQRGLVFTVPTDLIRPNHFYYACNRQGYYEIQTDHGGTLSLYTRDEYIQRIENHEFFSVVTRNKRFLFAGFHDGLPRRAFLKLVEEHGKQRDSQRQRMYRWQHLFELKHRHLLEVMSHRQSANLISKVLSDYGIPLDRVFYRDWNERTKRAIALHYTVPESWLTPGDFMLLVYRFGSTTLGTVLHEIAHSLTNTEYPWKRTEGHGPEYCTLLAELFARYAGFDIDTVYQSMHDAKLRTMPIEDYFDGERYPKYKRLE